MNTRHLRRLASLVALLAAAALLAPTLVSAQEELSPADEQGRYRYLVTLDDRGLLQRGVLPRKGEAAASRSPAFLSAQAELQAAQADALNAMAQELGRDVDASHRFLVSFNGLGVRLTRAEADRISALPGVATVERERVYQLDTYRGPEFIGAGEIWNGNATPDGSSMRGEGMVAAVLDSGTVLDHPSFANAASCGHGSGGTPDKLLSALDCASTDLNGLCNGPAPEPVNAHGVHVAGTVAGNTLDNTTNPPPNPPAPFTAVSGVAPCAHLRTYRVCVQGCPAFDIQAGMDSVLLHGDVDVMNFSISGGTSPWLDNDRRKLDLVAAGIFIAASAGNTRPPPGGPTNPVGEVNHRGPWVMSVAASTHDGSGQGDVLADFSLRGPTPAPLANLQKPDITGPGVSILASYGAFSLDVTQPTAPPNLQDVVLNPGSDSPTGVAFSDLPIRFHAGQTAGFEGCNPPAGVAFPASFFAGAAALIERGGCNFTEKINNASAAGAEMVVIYNNTAGDFGMSTPGQAFVPAFSASQSAGQDLRAYVGANPGAAITHGGTMDLSTWSLLSGTSMSSPHVAGAAALVRQAQPDWSPVEVKSAMQMTATGSAGTKEDGVTPWDWDDVGSGRVDLTAAALAGLVMNESYANFLAADPASGGDVRTLNLPSLRDVACSPDCSFVRRVSSAQPFATEWAVSAVSSDMTIDISPATFSLDGRTDFIFADGLEAVGIPTPVTSQELTITISNVVPGAIRFGEILLTEDGGLTPPARLTVAAEN